MMIVQIQGERFTKVSRHRPVPGPRRSLKQHALRILRKIVPMMQDRETHGFGEVICGFLIRLVVMHSVIPGHGRPGNAAAAAAFLNGSRR
jgi:hypothetical protein